MLLTMVTSLRKGSSGLRLVPDRSKSAPTFSGAQRCFFTPMAVLPAAPWTISIATRRRPDEDGPAAVVAYALPAGSMASRNGSATVTTMPFRTVRRERCFFVMRISWLLPLRSGERGFRLRHLERRTVHDAQNKGRKSVAVLGRFLHDRPNGRLVVIFATPAERIRPQVFGEVANHRLRVVDQRLPQARGSVEVRSIVQLRGRIDGDAVVLDPPRADDVEVFEREAERIDHAVTGRARGVLPVLLHALARRERLARLRRRFGVLERRHVRRRRRRRAE